VPAPRETSPGTEELAGPRPAPEVHARSSSTTRAAGSHGMPSDGRNAPRDYGRIRETDLPSLATTTCHPTSMMGAFWQACVEQQVSADVWRISMRRQAIERGCASRVLPRFSSWRAAVTRGWRHPVVATHPLVTQAVLELAMVHGSSSLGRHVARSACRSGVNRSNALCAFSCWCQRTGRVRPNPFVNLDRPAFRRHLQAIIYGNRGGQYEQQAVHE